MLGVDVLLQLEEPFDNHPLSKIKSDSDISQASTSERGRLIHLGAIPLTLIYKSTISLHHVKKGFDYPMIQMNALKAFDYKNKAILTK
jgi:hypothetical protein